MVHDLQIQVARYNQSTLYLMSEVKRRDDANFLKVDGKAS